MPVWRFKSHQEAERALWVPPGDASLVGTWRALMSFSVLAPQCPPVRGVRKFHTIEDANADTEAWIDRRVAEGRKRVMQPPRRGST
ncbi:MAG: hypothetical protein ACYCW6_15665 [Candidatus Xenobia bacterium]